jgi:hypothetical protein
MWKQFQAASRKLSFGGDDTPVISGFLRRRQM